jgi:energy-coupling factor transport system ATP-binding protein
MGDMISVKDVSFCYEGAESPPLALDGINLTVARGEYLAVIGHNGSGKSTLAKHFNALLKPRTGEVIIDGISTRDQERLYHIRQKVGMVFQNPDNQIVATTVEEDVAFGPENLGLPPREIRQRVDEALELVRMTDMRRHAPHLLSGGQKQRVAIAGVIAMRPQCLVLDEPTAMLDPRGREEVLQTVARLNREEGITVIYITHFMEEVRQAHNLVVMDQGHIVLTGSPRSVFSRGIFLRSLGLEVPPVTELAQRLKERGMPIAADIMEVEELVGSLCSWK